MDNRPTDHVIGYGIAYFRSHAISQEKGSWVIPDYFEPALTKERQTNLGDCQCGAGYLVSDQYHWHEFFLDRCHNRVKCE